MNFFKVKDTAVASVILLMINFPSILLAKEFCVSTAAELQAALDEASQNQDDDVIKVVQGRYVGNFEYNAYFGNGDLIIEGGYTPGCTSRVIDPLNTVIHGVKRRGFIDNALDIDVEDQSGRTDDTHNIKIEGLTLEAGSRNLKISLSNEGSITLTRNIILENTGTFSGGATLETIDGDISVTHNIFNNNRNIFGPGAVDAKTKKGSITITDNEMSFNEARATYNKYGEGGAIFAQTNDGQISILRNRLLQNSAEGDGGAIKAIAKNDGSITITGNTLSNNSADGNGGAVSASSFEGDIGVSGNTFKGNSATGDGGGFDLLAPFGRTDLGDNKIEGNHAGGDGGGGRTRSRTGTILYEKNNFSGNTAGGNGGGADTFLDEGTQKFIENLFKDNSAGGNGGGLNSDDADEESKEPDNKDKGVKDVSSLGNQFFNNSAGRGGGAHYEYAFADDEREPVISISGDQYSGNLANMTGAGLDMSLGAGVLSITNSAFTANVAGNTGGGAFIETTGIHTRILHSTATGNSAVTGGGFASAQIFDRKLDSRQQVDVINTIAYDNTANTGTDLFFDDTSEDNTGTTVLLDTNILGDWESTCKIDCVPNISEATTLLVDPMLSSDGIHLLSGSPATDAANLTFTLTEDIDGDPRPSDGDGDGVAASDIGADELPEVDTNTPPLAEANGPYTVALNETLLLDGSGSFDPDAGDAIVLYEWDLNGDGTFDISGEIPSVSPALRESFGIGTVGSYTISLRVTDNQSATDTDTAVLEVIPPPGTIAVTNTNDSGTGSLREAISIANASTLDTIIFSIPGSSPFTIQPQFALPQITNPVILDGSTQPGYAGATPVIVLDGNNTGANVDGLSISAGNSTVRGINIHSFDGNGITLSNSVGSNVVEGNFIGTDVSGSLDQGNGRNGINILASSGNQIIDNIISGNDLNGIDVFDVSDPVNSTVIRGNRIGVDATGTIPLGNHVEGIRIENSSNIQIGGSTSGDGNIIGANSDGASVIASMDITIQGNQWGDNSSIGNLGAALGFSGGSSNNLVEGNTFAFNGFGVIVFPGSTGITITKNRFYFQQLGPGIDLGFDGITENDLLDADTGANGLQNYPDILIADPFSVIGSLSSTPDTTFSVELFSSTSCHPSGFGEAENFIGAITVTTDSSGHATFARSLPVPVPIGHFITATAANHDGTSEFSQCREVIE